MTNAHPKISSPALAPAAPGGAAGARPGAVPEHAARFGAGLTAVTLLAALLGAPPWILLWLVPDFLARAADRRQWSVSGWLARALLAPRLPPAWRGRHTAWPPKRFAARVGLLALTATLAAWLLAPGSVAGPVLAAAMLLLCALEAAAGFCVACRLYGTLGRLGWVSGCANGRCEIVEEAT